MHDCVVQIRIKFLAYSFDRLHAHLIEGCHHLLVDHLHAFCKWIFLRCLCKASFEIIHDRKNLFNDVPGADDVHAGFLFLRSFTVVIELSHAALQSVCKLFNLLFKFIFLFFLLAKERSFCLRFRFLLGFFFLGWLLSFFCLGCLFGSFLFCCLGCICCLFFTSVGHRNINCFFLYFGFFIHFF